MRKEHIYSKLICGALLLFGICVPVCAQTGHLSGVRVINDEIKAAIDHYYDQYGCK